MDDVKFFALAEQAQELQKAAEEQQKALYRLMSDFNKRVESCIQTEVHRALEVEAGRAAAAIQSKLDPATEHLSQAASLADAARLKFEEAASWLGIKSAAWVAALLLCVCLLGWASVAVQTLRMDAASERLAAYKEAEERLKWRVPPKILNCDDKPCVRVLKKNSYGDGDVYILAPP